MPRLIPYLDELPVSALDSVRELAWLVVDLGVVEEVAVLTEFGGGHPSVALVVEIALLGVGEQAVRFRTVEPQRQVVIVICKKGLPN